ncbi:MAG: calcineurin-like phosphoesterase C-terminal domain-containing protein [Rikenellaceae bacterium]|nr:calcineurin-like phosphoesterase C-terminal domain-containing protein [Rikenellaceae bacterium]
MENYLAYVPPGSHVVLCAHSPFHLNRKLIDNADVLFGLLDGYRVRTLCGHTHINSNYEILPGILEHNIGACCGAWWTADSNKDGTPNGYQVFVSNPGAFSWYYKSIGREAGYQIEAYDRGTFPNRAQCVAVKAWNRDHTWKAEWYEDGVYKGEMEPFVARDPGYMRYL